MKTFIGLLAISLGIYLCPNVFYLGYFLVLSGMFSFASGLLTKTNKKVA